MLMEQVMSMEMAEIITALITLIISVIACLSLLNIAMHAGRSVDLVDRPTLRKVHEGNIPLVGGVAIFLTFLLMQLITPVASFPLLAASALLILVGMADDFKEVAPIVRLVFQAAAATILVVAGGYQINTLGALLSGEVVVLGSVFAIGFSIFCVIGVINAINMIDGADCLAGGIVTISILGLLAASMGTTDSYHLDSGLLIVLGATIAFLAFNSGLFGRHRKVFLGDSGSMFLGLLLAAYFINMSQGPDAYLSPVVAGWIFGLPLMDSIAVMVGRVIKGKSPLTAGRDHLHHLLLDKGISQPVCVGSMLTLHLILVGIGLLGNYFSFSMPVMFWGFVALVIAHYVATPKVIQHLEASYIRGPHRASN